MKAKKINLTIELTPENLSGFDGITKDNGKQIIKFLETGEVNTQEDWVRILKKAGVQTKYLKTLRNIFLDFRLSSDDISADLLTSLYEERTDLLNDSIFSPGSPFQLNLITIRNREQNELIKTGIISRVLKNQIGNIVWEPDWKGHWERMEELSKLEDDVIKGIIEWIKKSIKMARTPEEAEAIRKAFLKDYKSLCEIPEGLLIAYLRLLQRRFPELMTDEKIKEILDLVKKARDRGGVKIAEAMDDEFIEAMLLAENISNALLILAAIAVLIALGLWVGGGIGAAGGAGTGATGAAGVAGSTGGRIAFSEMIKNMSRAQLIALRDKLIALIDWLNSLIAAIVIQIEKQGGVVSEFGKKALEKQRNRLAEAMEYLKQVVEELQKRASNN